jgi:AraC-like DNA-binding protein
MPAMLNAPQRRASSASALLRQQLRRQLKAVLADSFDRYIPARIDDTFRPITSLTSLVTRRREHVARLRLRQAIIGIILDGRKELHIAGQTWRLVAGECFILPADIEMDAVNEPDDSSGSYRAIVLNLPAALILRTAAAYPSAIGNANGGTIAQTPVLEMTPAAIDSLVHAVQEIVMQPATGKTTADKATLAGQLIEHRVMEVMLHFADRILVGNTALPRIGDRARLHLCGHPARGWTAAALAAELNMSEATLRRQLKSEGHGFKRLLDQARMDLAQRLLADRSLSVDQIALSCGYAAKAKFEQRFKKLAGVTPQGYRQAQAA